MLVRRIRLQQRQCQSAGATMSFSIRLHHLLFLGFVLVALTPVLFHISWVEQPALEKEKAAVKEKHLIMAHNLTRAIGRYLTDVKAVFEFAIASASNVDADPNLARLIQDLHFLHLCLVDTSGNVLRRVDSLTSRAPRRIPPRLMTELATVAQSGRVTFTGVLPDSRGQPAVYLVKPVAENQLAIGALDTRYLVTLQQAITFGHKGHAAIVDQHGRVLAHPREEWRLGMRDLSALQPVQQMLKGESGVAFFYSPAVEMDMVAGFAPVDGVGWGVMVPQPVAELKQQVREVLGITAGIVILGILIAVVLGWWLAGLLAHPVGELTRAARAMASGRPGPRPQSSRLLPRELRSLIDSFNAMTAEITTANQALRQKSAFLQATLDNMGEGITLIDRDGRLVLYNHRFAELFEVPFAPGSNPRPLAELLVGPARNGEFGPLRDPEAAVRAWLGYLRSQAGKHLEHVRPNGRIIEIRCSALPVGGQVASYIDITERKQAEAELQLAAKALESTADGVMITTRQRRIISVNQAFTAITGYSAQETLGRDPSFLASGRHDQEFFTRLWQTLNDTDHWQGEIWNRRKNGEVFPEWLAISAVKDLDNQTSHYVGVFTDISQRKQAEARLDFLAYHDPLTQLPNRALFQIRCREALARADRHGYLVCLLFIDLDRFKTINDSLGHAIGDQLLQAAAERLAEGVRETDTLARLGGDEFTLLLDSLNDPQDGAAIAHKLITTLSQPFQLAGHLVYISASIGISCYPRDGRDVQTLLKNADAAMYQTKQEGRNGHRFFSTEMDAQAFESLVMSNSLRQALEKKEFELYYQPQVDLASGRISGVEALLRWHHPELGLVAPSRFIPLAEETGMIGVLSDWALKTACQQAQAWRDAGIPLPRIAVNLSARQFRRPELGREIAAILEETGLEPTMLELEITESMMIHAPQSTRLLLDEFRRLGMSVTIDDFGTGYSSLSFLKRFSIDGLKIDRSFVSDIPREADDAAIVKAIIAMATTLRLRVVAEGVETEEQHRFLCAEGCREGQGFLFGQASPAAALEPLLRANLGA